MIYVDPSGHWSLGNFVQSIFQALPYAIGFTNPYAAVAMGTMYSMQSTAANGGSDSDVLRAGGIGFASSAIGQGVAYGIGDFGGPVLQGAGAGFTSGGSAALMSGARGGDAWGAAFKGAAIGAGTAGVMWGVQQGVAAYQSSQRAHELAKMYAEATASSLDISGYPMYAMAGDASTQIVMDGGGDYWRTPTANEQALQSSWIGDLMIDSATMGTVGIARATLKAYIYKTVVTPRVTPSYDGATAQVVKVTNRITGKTVKVIHQVIKNGKIIHEHLLK